VNKKIILGSIYNLNENVVFLCAFSLRYRGGKYSLMRNAMLMKIEQRFLGRGPFASKLQHSNYKLLKCMRPTGFTSIYQRYLTRSRSSFRYQATDKSLYYYIDCDVTFINSRLLYEREENVY
jgi:hypothetical protein